MITSSSSGHWHGSSCVSADLIQRPLASVTFNASEDFRLMSVPGGRLAEKLVLPDGSVSKCVRSFFPPHSTVASTAS